MGSVRDRRRTGEALSGHSNQCNAAQASPLLEKVKFGGDSCGNSHFACSDMSQACRQAEFHPYASPKARFAGPRFAGRC